MPLNSGFVLVFLVFCTWKHIYSCSSVASSSLLFSFLQLPPKRLHVIVLLFLFLHRLCILCQHTLIVVFLFLFAFPRVVHLRTPNVPHPDNLYLVRSLGPPSSHSQNPDAISHHATTPPDSHSCRFTIHVPTPPFTYIPAHPREQTQLSWHNVYQAPLEISWLNTKNSCCMKRVLSDGWELNSWHLMLSYFWHFNLIKGTVFFSLLSRERYSSSLQAGLKKSKETLMRCVIKCFGTTAYFY